MDALSTPPKQLASERHPGHAHHHDDHHGHSHGPEIPHPPSAVPFSFLRLSVVSRLGIAAVAVLVLWGAILLAMK